MKLLKTTIKPISNFATTLRGDTIFGQLCWIIRHTFGEAKLKSLLADYDKAPFMIVSDAFAAGFFPKPKLPSKFLNEGSDKKANRKKIWLELKDLQQGNFANGKTAKEVGEDKVITVIRNSINYKTFTTDNQGFAPFGVQEIALGKKDIYFLIDEKLLNVEELNKAMLNLSFCGYGKDITTGKGRFEFCGFEESDFGETSSVVMALSPFSPSEEIVSLFYEPFTRFGKKGDGRANENPFKKPLLLADTGGVACFREGLKKQFIGKAIGNFSTHEDIVHQGYAIALPIKEIL